MFHGGIKYSTEGVEYSTEVSNILRKILLRFGVRSPVWVMDPHAFTWPLGLG